MPVTDQDARALTYLACRIRKETHGARAWDEAGTYSVVAELIGHSLATTTERVIRHAADPEAKTPGAIKRPFVPAAAEPGPRFPAKPGEDCRIHKGEWADTCRSCAADRLAGDTPRTPPLVSVPPPVTYLDARRGRETDEGSA
jgi:hypothetical protein